MNDTMVAFNNEILFWKSFSFFGSYWGIVFIILENIHPCSRFKHKEYEANDNAQKFDLYNESF